MTDATPNPHLALRQALEAHCGFQVTNVRDCQELLNAVISTNPNHRLGLSTLRRFFGLVEYKGGFSSTSLNILARYCGHSSFLAFCQSLEDDIPGQSSKRTSPAARVLEETFQHLRQHGQCNVLQLRDMVRASIQIQGLPDEAAKWWAEAHRHKSTRKPYTELAPPLDWMVSFGQAQMLDFLHHADSDEERTYARSLLAFGHIMQGNWTEATPHLELLPLTFQESIHPLPQARAFSLHLMLAAAQKRWVDAGDVLDAMAIGLDHQEVHASVPFFQRLLTPYLCVGAGQAWPDPLRTRILALIERCWHGLDQWLSHRDPFIDSPEGVGWYAQSALMAAALIGPLEDVERDIARFGFQASFASDKTIQAAQFHTIAGALAAPGSSGRSQSEKVVQWAIERMQYPQLGVYLKGYGAAIAARR